MVAGFLVSLIILLSLSQPASPPQAGGVVTICDEAHLKTALAGGGTVTFACSGTITLMSTITVSANTTIDGSGQAVIISGNQDVRVFIVNPGKTLRLKGLTIANGFSPLGGEGGGGIYNRGTVIVNNSTISGNHAGNRGGGIYNVGGFLTVRNSTFTGNTATWGACIYNSDLGTLTVSNSTFSNNGVLEVGGGIVNESGVANVRSSTFADNDAPGDAGGISNSGTLTISNSTFSANSGAWHGGGISNSGSLTIGNSTFSGNSASLGGGIFNFEGTIQVINSTLSGNSASDTGGSIYNDSGTIHLGNSIIANSPTGGNCVGPIDNDGGNLSFGDTTCPGTHNDPLLGPLQDNGGTTYTMALSPESPAIDTAVAAICAAPPVNNRDQRGVVRPVDGDKDNQAVCDIGSFEYQPGVTTTYRFYLPLAFID